MAKLTFVLEDGQEVVVPLKEHITLGRGEDNDIVVDDERISMHHAEIVQNADGSLQVFDLKSLAGTFVNGERQLSCTLLHGDTIAFGPLVGTLDLEHPATSPAVVDTPVAPPASSSTTKVPSSETPAPEVAVPEAPSASAPPDKAHVEDMAKLEAEKSRLKAEVDAVEKELREWQQRAEKERALHLARVESLTAEEKKLAPVKDAVQQAENAHREWLESITSLTSQHEDKTAALERLNTQHYEKSTEVQRLTATAEAAQQQIENLADQKKETDARLKQVRDECAQDEAALNSLRQQIIEHEKRIIEEEAKHASLKSTEVQRLTSTATTAQQEIENLAAQKEQADARLKQVRNECAQDEAALNSLRQQIIEHEKRIIEEEAKHASLKSTEVQRLTSTATTAQQEIENLAAQKDQADARLKQVRDECEQDEAVLNSLRQQIIEHEKRIIEEEAKHTSLNTASTVLSAKQQRDEAAVKDLESRLMSLEQKGAAAEGSLQRLQQDIASCEKNLAARKAELATYNAALAAETGQHVEVGVKRAELEQLNQDLAAAKQQLIDARKRLAAVEQRYRDAQSNDSQGGSQIAPPRRQATQEDAPQTDATTNGVLHGQIEAARHELAELEFKIAALRELQSAAGSGAAQDTSSISPPVIVQVETIKLAPIPIKSERTRGPGTKSAAPLP